MGSASVRSRSSGPGGGAAVRRTPLFTFDRPDRAVFGVGIAGLWWRSAKTGIPSHINPRPEAAVRRAL
jgi:hypothetical protein